MGTRFPIYLHHSWSCYINDFLPRSPVPLLGVLPVGAELCSWPSARDRRRKKDSGPLCRARWTHTGSLGFPTPSLSLQFVRVPAYQEDRGGKRRPFPGRCQSGFHQLSPAGIRGLVSLWVKGWWFLINNILPLQIGRSHLKAARASYTALPTQTYSVPSSPSRLYFLVLSAEMPHPARLSHKYVGTWDEQRPPRAEAVCLALWSAWRSHLSLLLSIIVMGCTSQDFYSDSKICMHVRKHCITLESRIPFSGVTIFWTAAWISWPVHPVHGGGFRN